MTTKLEFDSFIAGFKLAGHDHISMEQLDVILAKVDDLVAGLTASATDDAATAVVSDTADTTGTADVTEAVPVAEVAVAEAAPVDTANVVAEETTTADGAVVATA